MASRVASRSMRTGACGASSRGRNSTTASLVRSPSSRLNDRSQHMARARIGTTAEDLAAEFLQAQGLELLSRNYRRRGGEIDLIARRGDVLGIVEVRTRSTQCFGGAAASVDGWKQHKIVRAASQLLQQHKALARLRVRFDVIVVHEPEGVRPRVEWIKHAFEAPA